MLRASVIILLLLSTAGFSQSSEKYKSDYARFYKAEDLYKKMKYSAAEEEFKLFMAEQDDPNDPLYSSAMYYSALSAIKHQHFIIFHTLLILKKAIKQPWKDLPN